MSMIIEQPRIHILIADITQNGYTTDFEYNMLIAINKK